MKGITYPIAAALVFVCSAVFADIKPCDELKSEIEAKLKEKGVIGYTLEIMPAGQVKDQKVVGSCEGGTKKIIYSRGAKKKTEKE